MKAKTIFTTMVWSAVLCLFFAPALFALFTAFSSYQFDNVLYSMFVLGVVLWVGAHIYRGRRQMELYGYAVRLKNGEYAYVPDSTYGLLSGHIFGSPFFPWKEDVEEIRPCRTFKVTFAATPIMGRLWNITIAVETSRFYLAEYFAADYETSESQCKDAVIAMIRRLRDDFKAYSTVANSGLTLRMMRGATGAYAAIFLARMGLQLQEQNTLVEIERGSVVQQSQKTQMQ